VEVEKDGDQLAYHVRNEEVGLLHTAKERNILHTIKKRKAIWIGHCL
jgi:hypothetical protein